MKTFKDLMKSNMKHIERLQTAVRFNGKILGKLA